MNRVHIGIGLLALFAAPLYFPPAAAPPAPPGEWASLLERLFPGVPTWWVAGRLVCLATGLALLLSRRTEPGPTRDEPAADDVPRSGGPATVALLFAASLAFVGPLAAYFPRQAQFTYLAALFVPWLITRLGETRPATRLPWRVHVASGAVIALWLLVWVPWGWRSPWILNVVDVKSTLGLLIETTEGEFNLLTDASQRGQGFLYLVLHGAGLLDRIGVEPTVYWAQACNLAWQLVTAGLLSLAAGRIVGPAAAPVATAVFLFSPVGAMMPLLAGPFIVGSLTFAACALLLEQLVRHRAPSALVGLGSIAGFTLTMPSLLPLGGVVAIIALAAGWRRVPGTAIAAALAAGAAVVVPFLPELARLPETVAAYGNASGSWSFMEAMYFGQVYPELAYYQKQSASPGAWDAWIGTVLLPFATPRTPIRVLGDAPLEPVGTVLLALGIAASLRGPALHRGLLLLLGAAMLGGIVTNYDRVSVIRLPAFPGVAALIAAFGFRSVAGPIGAPKTVAACIVIALSGTWMVYGVHPRTLPRSSNALALELARTESARPFALLAADGMALTHAPSNFSSLPEAGIAVHTHGAGASSLPDVPDGGLVAWPPAVEERDGVSKTFCAQDPAARITTLRDETGHSRLFVLAPGNPAWQAALPNDRWEAAGCDQPLDTASHRARTALLRAEGAPVEIAIPALREAARASFVQYELYRVLAERLAQNRERAVHPDEALGWARRAARVSRACDAAAVDTLERILVDTGRTAEARSLREERDRVAPHCRQLPPWDRR